MCSAGFMHLLIRVQSIKINQTYQVQSYLITRKASRLCKQRRNCSIPVPKTDNFHKNTHWLRTRNTVVLKSKHVTEAKEQKSNQINVHPICHADCSTVMLSCCKSGYPKQNKEHRQLLQISRVETKQTAWEPNQAA